MTYEMQMWSICDHRVHREMYTMSWEGNSDFRTIRLIQPISDQEVRVWYIDKELLQTDVAFGWSLAYDEYSVPEDPKTKIVFNRPIKDINGIFEISYSVRQDLCRKCFGLGLLWDHSIDNLGRLRTIVREEKLEQTILKYLLTIVNSNPFYPFIGTSIPNVIKQKITNAQALQEQVSLDIKLALNRLKNNQINQLDIQILQAEEILDRILLVDVIQDPVDNRIFYINILVSTLAGTEVPVERQLYLGDRFVSLPVRETGV